MVGAQQIVKYFEQATNDFKQAREYRDLVGGSAGMVNAYEFLRNIFRTHYLSSHIIALCFASLPSAAAEMLKENLLEEMGRSESEPPHSALLMEMARVIGFTDDEVNQLIADARRRVALVCASRVPVATLRELCLSVLLETMSFEFMQGARYHQHHRREAPRQSSHPGDGTGANRSQHRAATLPRLRRCRPRALRLHGRVRRREPK